MAKPQLLSLMCVAVTAFTSCSLAAQTLATARSLAKRGRIDAAIVEAQKAVATTGNNEDAQKLLCGLYGSIDRYDDAIRACEAAHTLQPGNADVTLALARAYGVKASHAGTFTGMRMVGRIRENFEAAVQQDGRNADALSDLGEFYLEAPAVVGGGSDKARALVPRLRAVSPARAARLEGMIASKAGDLQAADAAYQRELAISHSAEAYVDLASFKRKQKLWAQAEQNALLAIQSDDASGPDTLDAVLILLDLNRSLPAAEKALRSYLSHDPTSAIADYPRAHVMLGQLLQREGNTAGAQQQFTQALALVANYGPARKAMHP